MKVVLKRINKATIQGKIVCEVVTICGFQRIIAHPHLLVQATIERFQPVKATFKVDLANDNH